MLEIKPEKTWVDVKSLQTNYYNFVLLPLIFLLITKVSKRRLYYISVNSDAYKIDKLKMIHKFSKHTIKLRNKRNEEKCKNSK